MFEVFLLTKNDRWGKVTDAPISAGCVHHPDSSSHPTSGYCCGEEVANVPAGCWS